jgi:hypothetical protein
MRNLLLKRLTFLWVFLAINMLALNGISQSQEIVFANTASESYSVNLLADRSNVIELNFDLNQFVLNEVGTDEYGSMAVPTSGNAPLLLQKGSPEIFYLTSSVIIPDFGSTELLIEPGDFVEYTNVDIAPSKGVLTRDINPLEVPYKKGETYKKDAFFPGDLASLRKPFIVRDYRGQTVEVYPIQYNPVTKTLRVYKNIKISIISESKSGINEFKDSRTNQNVLAEFDQIYKRNFINYSSSAKYTPIDEDGLMLVVAHDDYIDAIKPLVNWKNQKGQPTMLVSYTEAGGSSANLKTYITNQYNSEEGLTFVLLVGDSQHIPPMSKSGDSDPAYGHIVGTDSYAEVFVGRFSAESVAHVETQVARTITYERDLTNADTWLKTGMGIASSEGGGGQGDNGESDIQHMNIIRDNLLAYTYDNVHQVYDPGAAASTVVSNLNNGLSIINYVGHGSDYAWVTTGFGVSNMSSLTNVNMLPYIFDVACVNGNFAGQTCFAEGFMRASTAEGPTGSVAIIASTINQSWASPMRGQDEMNDILTESYAENIKRTFGGITVNGCMHMNDEYGTDGYNMTNTWTIFGDPSLIVRTDTPSEMVVSHNPTLFLGSNSFSVSCDTDGALVAISTLNAEDDIELLGKAIVEGGSAVVSFEEAIVNPADLIVTVTAYNKTTYQGVVSAVPADEPYVVLNSFETDIAPDYGQTVTLDVIFENISEDPYTASSVSASITSENPSYVTVVDNSEEVGTVNPGQQITLVGAFSFSISDDVPDQTPLVFTLTIEGEYDSDIYQWEQTFTIKANAPVLTFGSMTLMDSGNGDGVLDAGETAEVSIALSNTGHASASGISTQLATASGHLTIVDGTYDVAALAAGASVQVSYTVEADSDTPLGTPAGMTATATAGAYSAEGAYEVIIGFVPEYCASGATSGSDSDLTGFTFGPLENVTAPGGQYDDFTEDPELVHEFSIGETYDVSVTLGSAGGTYTKGAKVFIDWNYDGDFDDEGETAFEVAPQNQNWTATGTITIPEDATPGPKFVRVVVKETSDISSITPCGTYTWGGTEDYKIILTGKRYAVTFAVKDSEENPMAGAMVSLTGYGAKLTNSSGMATFASVDQATGIAYGVSYAGYNPVEGTVDVVNSDVTEPVTMVITSAGVSMLDRVQAYPNPFGAQLTLEGTERVARVEVISLVGQRMLVQANAGEGTLELPTEALQPGVYLIRLTDLSGNVSTLKVVKK